MAVVAKLLLDSGEARQASNHRHQQSLMTLQHDFLERMQTRNLSHQKDVNQAILHSALITTQMLLPQQQQPQQFLPQYQQQQQQQYTPQLGGGNWSTWDMQMHSCSNRNMPPMTDGWQQQYYSH